MRIQSKRIVREEHFFPEKAVGAPKCGHQQAVLLLLLQPWILCQCQTREGKYFACLAAVQVPCRLQAGKRPALGGETVEINNFPSKIKSSVIIMLNHTVMDYEWRQHPGLSLILCKGKNLQTPRYH